MEYFWQSVPEGGRIGSCVRNDLQFCLSSHRIHGRLVCTGERSGESEVDCMGKQAYVDSVVQFHARIRMRDSVRENLAFDPFGDGQPVRQRPQDLMWYALREHNNIIL